jgi:hypothetical protein
VAVNPATSSDLVARSLRPLTPQEIVWGETRLGDAFGQLVAARPSIATRLDAGDLPFKALVIQVLCAMVLRVLSNPNGKLEESIDDYRYRLDAAVSTGSLYATDAEIALLSAGDGASDGAFTIRPYGAGVSRPDTWVTFGSAGI